ncbi:hypothetical protein GOP47_0014244 [Adiantum capillus-veneris]|uniref:Dehydrogenase E1 component domain-containing protein n=1 Tax=Adiantum capillus-veneris TaxID=13818 RepID=A0A9D4ULY8_ADICA|nr:hypothetical protein GOP47_0014244 [Adiantum capillus-veneris]
MASTAPPDTNVNRSWKGVVVYASSQELLADKPSVIPAAAITREEGLILYEDMVLWRSFEDMCAQMYIRGKMFGFVHLYNGQEAVSTGFIKNLKPEDYV